MAEGALLAGRGLTKSFGHVQALRGVDFDVPTASITGLVGDNGAGKSTLIGVLSGVLQPDDGDDHSSTASRSPCPTRSGPRPRHRDGLPGPRAGAGPRARA